MASSILNQLFGRCSHQFSWPRKSLNSTYYQVCLRCGAQYAYDWDNMRRTGRLEAMPKQLESSAPAPRMRVGIEVYYREVAANDWSRGVTADVSETGVKITGQTRLHPGAPIEIVFEMPEHISGETGSHVMCTGRVVRVVEQSTKETAPALAATLHDYRYVSELPAGVESGAASERIFL